MKSSLQKGSMKKLKVVRKHGTWMSSLIWVGLKKTTLAQLAFNDAEVMTHFEKKIWVCVPEPFDEKFSTSVPKYTSGQTHCSMKCLNQMWSQFQVMPETNVFQKFSTSVPKYTSGQPTRFTSLDSATTRFKEDDAAFERQSTLFALEIADVVIKRSSKQPKKHYCLLYVITQRLHLNIEFIFEDIEKHFLRSYSLQIWDAVPEPETTTLYERSCCDRKKVKSASFSIYAEDIWKTIKENKDLDLPSIKVMVATFRCEAIAEEKLKCLTSNKRWLAIKEDVQAGPVPGFGEDVTSILETFKSVKTSLQQSLNEGREYVLLFISVPNLACAKSLLEASERNTWALVRDVFECNTEKAISEFSDAAAKIDTKFQHLREFAEIY
uniref:GB1/RHD3-type G domain-containing protein n=1 Tax=Salix viminalis TaxID=40686 RepID=A0A6N2K9N7_SALVM